jgi:hypothetical protein
LILKPNPEIDGASCPGGTGEPAKLHLAELLLSLGPRLEELAKFLMLEFVAAERLAEKTG